MSNSSMDIVCCSYCGALGGTYHLDSCIHDGEVKQPPPLPKTPQVKKFDEGKPDLSYLMDAPLAMEGFCRVMKLGESKYGRDNWKLHKDHNRLIAALLRHLMAWQDGEKIDPESNLSHLHHVVANAVMLAENFTLRTEKNNG